MKKNIFQTIQLPKLGRSMFDMSYNVKMSFKQGQLVPCHVQEVVPGDVFTQSVDSVIRFAPMVGSPMHRYYQTVHYWFVPYRLVWANFSKFIVETDPSSAPAMPTLNLNSVNSDVGTLADYLSACSSVPGTKGCGVVSALWFAAYQMVYNQRYRDQNLITEVPFALVDGDNDANAAALLTLRNRAWEHDYLTSCLPTAQKGDTVSIPIGTFDDVAVIPSGAGGSPIIYDPATGSPRGNPADLGTDVDGSLLSAPDDSSPSFDAAIDPNGTLSAQTSSLVAEAATINNLRQAFAVQRWKERAIRGGSRLIEWTLAMFGVRMADKTVQDPQYLGGLKSDLTISEVVQTSSTADTPQGNIAGHGLGIAQGKAFRHHFEDYGVVIGIASVMPATGYQQGLPRAFKRFSPLDFYNPLFAHLGEQEVMNYEVYNDPTDSTNEDIFGYQSRWAEMKYNANRAAGQFRTTLNFWTSVRIFDSRPGLNGNFVTSDPTKRIFADEDSADDEIWACYFHQIQANRIMPYYGSPGGV